MAEPTTAVQTPTVIIDLGKVKKKQVTELKQGRGDLATEVQEVLAETRARLGPELATKELVPVVVVYRRKRRRKGGKGFGRMLPF
jgi:hypothetical protein